MKLAEIREGTTDLLVPKKTISHLRGPSSSKMGVFFNPVMEFNRDVSILAMRNFLKGRSARLLDGLAGTGARGIRIASEVKGDYSVVINDRNPMAFELIKKNIVKNELDICEAENQKMNVITSKEDFDYVDIDPFGSPVRFIDSSIQSLRKNGVLAITATDTAPLCGTHPTTCERRYGARSYKTSYSKETGARILAGFCVRQAAKYDIALTPILTFFSDHYFRIHFDVKKGARRAEAALEDIGYIYHDPKTKERGIVNDLPYLTKEKRYAGPLWTGNIHDGSLLQKLQPESNLGTNKKIIKFIYLWREECPLPPFFYEINEIASLTRTQPKSLQRIVDNLNEHGIMASRTHFSPNGFKTEADIFEIKRLISEI
ncbi:MAG: tRNA (guanine(10)-N(2))-dimethyltransferase [Thermoplasmata archaeon]|nr:MAG: tRNA (guanine(10)-N(2))-dimethyltransferase [Thermoplasmata archaeon]